MCDLETENDIDEFVKQGGKLNRRQFAKATAIEGFEASLPRLTNLRCKLILPMECAIPIS
jgi:hypothetical protein